MNIEGLGSETIETFYRQGIVMHISDLYTIYERSNQLKNLDRFGERSINNMLDGIEKSKQMPYDRVLFGLGIRFVGATVAKKIAAHFKNIDSLINASFEELVSVDEIGDRIAQSLIAYFKEPRHLEQIEKLRNYGLQFQAEEKIVDLKSRKLEGKTFIISGVFATYSRDELKDMIEENGGKILSTISAKLNYLVAGDNMGPSKLDKAKKLNIPLISDEELIAMIK
jgi:DNA ligase (NAD+)